MNGTHIIAVAVTNFLSLPLSSGPRPPPALFFPFFLSSTPSHAKAAFLSGWGRPCDSPTYRRLWKLSSLMTVFFFYVKNETWKGSFQLYAQWKEKRLEEENWHFDRHIKSYNILNAWTYAREMGTSDCEVANLHILVNALMGNKLSIFHLIFLKIFSIHSKYLKNSRFCLSFR